MTGLRRTAPERHDALMVIAKVPEPGRVKTRLSPPLTAHGACQVAWACLLDTLDVVAQVDVERRVLVLDGRPGSWIPPGFDIIAQRGDGLAARLTAAFEDVFASGSSRGLVIAMDTPQVDCAMLRQALDALATSARSLLGPATDGGDWAIGLRSDVDPAAVFLGIPMSTPDTGLAQGQRLCTVGYAPHVLPTLRDIDDIDDLLAVSLLVPQRRIATITHALFAHTESLLGANNASCAID